MPWDEVTMGPHRLICGDALAVLQTLVPESLDAVVTDPPYGLEFMGKAWDGPEGFRQSLPDAEAGDDQGEGHPSLQPSTAQAGHLFHTWSEAWARACLRVLKPGGHLVAFGGSRTYHRLACAIEDAGFEIRDQLMWLYASGWPKNLDIAKALHDTTWDGWGTGLKPAHEPIVLARKPLRGTVTANVQRYGTGALHIAACRVPGPEPHHNYGRTSGATSMLGYSATPSITPQSGRWPANVLHDGSEGVLEAFPQTHSGGRFHAQGDLSKTNGIYGVFPSRTQTQTWHADSGTAARFFYTAKASPAERDDGLPLGRKNTHPTVKPLALMRYLVQLVTPPGGQVLDPFMGSGTTGCACASLGHAFLGMERDPAYFALACQRLESATRQLNLFHQEQV